MNYLAHGIRFVHDPYMLAGTAVPDWLAVANRNVRARANHAKALASDADPRVAAVARGIMQHHHDDAWFHNTEAFNLVAWKIAEACRDALPAEEGFRPSFLGHILTEILLDWAIAAVEPSRLDEYYDAMAQVDPAVVEQTVNRMTGKQPERLCWFIERFCHERFLCDYADDAKLLFRLNQVMRRVRLQPLPDSFRGVLSAGRVWVADSAEDLLSEEVRDAGVRG